MSVSELVTIFYLRKLIAPSETNAQALTAIRADMARAAGLIAREEARKCRVSAEQIAAAADAASADAQAFGV